VGNDSTSGRVAERNRHSKLVSFLIRLAREKPLGMTCGIIALLMLSVGIFADFIAPYGMNETWVGGFLEPPSAKFWLGTDNVGRCVLSRIIYGARISVIVGFAATSIATAISALIGIVCGYIGGKLDILVQRLVDTWMCLPSLILLILMVTVIGPSLATIIIVLGVAWGIPGSRIIRGAVIAIKENVYLQAATAIGCSTSRILTRHILPNVLATIIVLFTVRVPGIILAEASLSFLGYGIPPPFPSWGSMLSGAGRKYMYKSPGLAVWPGLALALTVYSINMFGDAVRDITDPRLKGGGRRYGAGVKKEAKKVAQKG